MRSRPKLSGAPLAYTLAKVDGTTDHYTAFGKALWSEDGAVTPAMKELVFLRASIVNQCPT
ncbi:MAG: carboxymuconolactone decarboxylase family protein [Actinomycetota bacterium]